MTNHPKELRDRVVIITGGGRGIGRAFADVLAEAGCRLLLTAGSSRTELDASVAELRASVGKERVAGLLADVRDPVAGEAVAAEAMSRWGRIDALVNNAGIGMRLVSETFNTKPIPFWEAPVDKWRHIFETNAEGPWMMARAAAPHMVRAGAGRIINITTSPVTMIRRGYAPYGPSKAALESFTRIWAQDLAGSGVTCNALMPGGATATSFLPEGHKQGADGMSLAPTVMNAALLWLLSDASAAVSGRKFVGRLWNDALPPDEAARGAMTALPELPSIL